MDSAVAELVDRVRAAISARRLLRIRGGGSKEFYGNVPRGEPLDTSSHRGIVTYEPSELVIVARAGTPLRELGAALAREGQMLAFEPPHFGDAATVGGCVAAGLSGPRRASGGSVRDSVLGAKLVDGRGSLLGFGGTVVKNVAGYDVSRVLAGSLGTLGVIVEAALKVVPRPRCETTLRFELGEAAALEAINRWCGQPLPISASAWLDGVLSLRLSGSDASVIAAAAKLGGESLQPDDGAAFWSSLREQRHAFFAGTDPLWRLSVPSTTPCMTLSGTFLHEWNGALRWLRTLRPAVEVRAACEQVGGHATLFRRGDSPSERLDHVFMPLSPTLAAIHDRLLREFDPHAVFDRGRLFPASRDAH